MTYLDDLDFERPAELQASLPPELRGEHRGDVRLLLSGPDGHQHAHFSKLPLFLMKDDLLVVNDSATLPASLRATGAHGDFTLNLSTHYGQNLWLAEPRISPATPGPLPVQAGESFRAAGLTAAFITPHPKLPRLWFVQFGGDVMEHLSEHGQPIRYGYVPERYGLDVYQTVFGTAPGSAEMASAARPFTRELVAELKASGVQFAAITLHTGVSSLEIKSDTLDDHNLYAEPFEVSAKTTEQINRAKAEGRRVIAIGTTVVRALASSWNGNRLKPARGFTSKFIRPGAGAGVPLDGLLTGFHDPKASHLAMLYAVAGKEPVRAGYEEAVAGGYLWHEFGDSHLLLV